MTPRSASARRPTLTTRPASSFDAPSLPTIPPSPAPSSASPASSSNCRRRILPRVWTACARTRRRAGALRSISLRCASSFTSGRLALASTTIFTRASRAAAAPTFGLSRATWVARPEALRTSRRLRRLRSGAFSVDDASTLDDFGDGEAAVRPPLDAVSHLPMQRLTEVELGRVSHGNPVPARTDGQLISLLDDSGALVAVADRHDDELRPKTVLADAR